MEFEYNDRVTNEYSVLKYGWIFFLYYMLYLIEIQDYESCEKIKALLLKADAKYKLEINLSIEELEVEKMLFEAFDYHGLTGKISHANIAYYIDSIHDYLTEEKVGV